MVPSKFLVATATLPFLAVACTDKPKATAEKTPQVTAPANSNGQMAAVLQAHASLKPKPIEKRSPPEARRQPSPADGVNHLLQGRRAGVGAGRATSVARHARHAREPPLRHEQPTGSPAEHHFGKDKRQPPYALFRIAVDGSAKNTATR